MIVFRNAAPEDAQIIADMSLVMNEEDGHPITHDILKAVNGLIAQPELGQITIIEYEGKMIGFFALCYGYSLELGGKDCCLDELYILPEYRGQGFGKQTMAHAVKCAKDAQAITMYLEVVDGNEKAAALYKAYGFEMRGRIMYKEL